MKQRNLFLQAIENEKHDILNLLQDIVRIPSITGQEEEVQKFIGNHLTQLGLQVDLWRPLRSDLQSHPAFSDDGLPLGERPVVVARWQGTGKGRSLILNGHVDVVPVGDASNWKYGPWSGEYRDDQVWGRGSCDMKGGLVAGIAAVTALRSAGFVPAGDVMIQSVIGEETGGAGTLATIVRGYRADSAIILEPTKLAICPVGAGAATFRLRVTGRAAHGAMRETGVSAVTKYYLIQRALQNLERKRHTRFHNPLYEQSTLAAPISVGKVQAGDWPSTVPESLIAEGRYGVFPGEPLESARKEFEKAIGASARTDAWLLEHPPVVEWFEGQFESAQSPIDAPVLQLLRDSHLSVLKRAPAVHGVSYGSDLRFFTNNANMHAVLYGPGDVSLAHSLDEHIPFQEVIDAAKVIGCTILNWCDGK